MHLYKSDLDEEGALAAADVTDGSTGPRGGQEGQQVGGHVTAQHARNADTFNTHTWTESSRHEADTIRSRVFPRASKCTRCQPPLFCPYECPFVLFYYGAPCCSTSSWCQQHISTRHGVSYPAMYDWKSVRRVGSCARLCQKGWPWACSKPDNDSPPGPGHTHTHSERRGNQGHWRKGAR